MLDNKEKIVNSSIIQSYTYNPDTQTVDIVFKSDTGNTWQYAKVTQSLIDQVFNSSGSVGSKFIRLIKNGHKAILLP